MPTAAATGAQAASVQDHAFIALQRAYRPHGGLSGLPLRSDGSAAPSGSTDAALQALLDGGLVFGFAWHHACWVPLFQIGHRAPALAAVPRRVIAEFGQQVDGWSLAGWFVRPNSSLAGRCPIDCLATRLPEVLEAARTDSFLAAV